MEGHGVPATRAFASLPTPVIRCHPQATPAILAIHATHASKGGRGKRKDGQDQPMPSHAKCQSALFGFIPSEYCSHVYSIQQRTSVKEMTEWDRTEAVVSPSATHAKASQRRGKGRSLPACAARLADLRFLTFGGMYGTLGALGLGLAASGRHARPDQARGL